MAKRVGAAVLGFAFIRIAIQSLGARAEEVKRKLLKVVLRQ